MNKILQKYNEIDSKYRLELRLLVILEATSIVDSLGTDRFELYLEGVVSAEEILNDYITKL